MVILLLLEGDVRLAICRPISGDRWLPESTCGDQKDGPNLRAARRFDAWSLGGAWAGLLGGSADGGDRRRFCRDFHRAKAGSFRWMLRQCPLCRPLVPKGSAECHLGCGSALRGGGGGAAATARKRNEGPLFSPPLLLKEGKVRLSPTHLLIRINCCWAPSTALWTGQRTSRRDCFSVWASFCRRRKRDSSKPIGKSRRTVARSSSSKTTPYLQPALGVTPTTTGRWCSARAKGRPGQRQGQGQGSQRQRRRGFYGGVASLLMDRRG